MIELLSEVAGTSISGRDRVSRYRHSLDLATGLSAQAPASAGCRAATLCSGPSRQMLCWNLMSAFRVLRKCWRTPEWSLPAE